MNVRLRYGWLLVSLVALIGLTGCVSFEWNYVFSAAGGEIRLIASAVPIEQGLEDPTLSEEDKEKLRLVIDVRDYAINEVGLNVGKSYQTFVNLYDQPLAWNLSASPKDVIEPYYWNLPFVGPIPYLGFFYIDEAYQERDRLVEQGYDTLIYEVDAYSTVGIMPDPVTSALLKRESYGLVDTVLHELTHNTIYTGRDTVFDESLAVFVARTAAMEYLVDRHGLEGEMTLRARESYEDNDRFNAFLDDLRDRLDAIYAGDISRDEKIAAREPVFDDARQRLADEILPLMHHPETYETYTTFNFNNAYLMVNVRYYSEYDLLADVYERTGGDWTQALDRFRQAAAADDPFSALRQQLAE